jgi:tetratricopeptide (TPR) repeat protein
MFKVELKSWKAKQAFKQGDHRAVINNAGAALLARPELHELWKIMGLAHFALGEWEKAHKSLMRAADGLPADLEIALCLARSLVRLGEDLEYRGFVGDARKLFEDALARCDAAVAASPEDFRVYACRSLSLFGLARYEDALRDSETARRLNKGMPHLTPTKMLRKIVEAQRRGERIERTWSAPGEMKLTKAISYEDLAKGVGRLRRKQVFAGRDARAAA